MHRWKLVEGQPHAEEASREREETNDKQKCGGETCTWTCTATTRRRKRDTTHTEGAGAIGDGGLTPDVCVLVSTVFAFGIRIAGFSPERAPFAPASGLQRDRLDVKNICQISILIRF